MLSGKNLLFIVDKWLKRLLVKKQFLVFSLLLFCFSKKSNKKGAPKSNTARFREAALFSRCTTVACTLIILLLGAVTLLNKNSF